MTKLSPQELALYRQCINVALHGFDNPAMERAVGVSYAALMKEDAAFFALRKASADITSDDLAIPLRPLLIAEVLRQLNTEEFQARTNSSKDEGYRLLEKAKTDKTEK